MHAYMEICTFPRHLLLLTLLAFVLVSSQDSTTGRLACQSAPTLAGGAPSLDTTAPGGACPALGLLARQAALAQPLDRLRSRIFFF